MALVKTVSADSKNNSLELNEFIKMIARDIKRDATGSRDELLEAFRSSPGIVRGPLNYPEYSRFY